ncbi:probable sodium/metabolite cotransporter BASS5, chloroplastic isoform X2 [Nymphaea colorata]|uniref:probable sodium/metabolite cotransporter BASS5, chloroplastic isoform X2 n=1 Tax=Nymphaea colorata TaxID=210225 RepID=UPI00129EBBC1|nr:probable sodium/metabolite cotransporter BASS5, chloroplastic isoform X2 [Nymphaea colorata]
MFPARGAFLLLSASFSVWLRMGIAACLGNPISHWATPSSPIRSPRPTSFLSTARPCRKPFLSSLGDAASPFLSQFRKGVGLSMRCRPEKGFDFSPTSDGMPMPAEPSLPSQIDKSELHVLEVLKTANSYLPHAVVASTFLALVYPPSFTWFTTRYYAPALGFLMFAVGVNSSAKDFIDAIARPAAIAAGYAGQFIVKPTLGYLFGTMAVGIFHLPDPIDPSMAPLSIVMTSISTATAVLITPILSLLLIGKRLPVDVKGMMSSIIQIVVAPIAAGLLLNRFIPGVCSTIRPFLPFLSVLVTALCVGSPLAINIKSILSPFGMVVLLLIVGFHASAFISGYVLTDLAFHKAPDVAALRRTMSFETGMQSSLLALALANKFFQDPLVGVPPAISVVIMSLMGFLLVTVWAKKRQRPS